MEYINFGSLGKILENEQRGRFLNNSDHQPDHQDQPPDPPFWAEELKLTYFSELDPIFVNVPRLESLAPHIQHISLSVPINVNLNGFINSNVNLCNQVRGATGFPVLGCDEELLET